MTDVFLLNQQLLIQTIKNLYRTSNVLKRKLYIILIVNVIMDNIILIKKQYDRFVNNNS